MNRYNDFVGKLTLEDYRKVLESHQEIAEMPIAMSN